MFRSFLYPLRLGVGEVWSSAGPHTFQGHDVHAVLALLKGRMRTLGLEVKGVPLAGEREWWEQGAQTGVGRLEGRGEGCVQRRGKEPEAHALATDRMCTPLSP